MKDNKDLYEQELSKLQAFEEYKSMLYDKSIGGDYDRPPDSFIELHVGKQKDDQQLKQEALAKAITILLEAADKDYCNTIQKGKDQVEKTDQEKKQEHLDKAIERYKDRDDQLEQGRDEQSRDEQER
ncbi:MAG: hypothetical protein H6858_04895 [Rhodospirillales bacterium]|nr:hypothetical protein [Rhodospirillales bacterium]